jgi:hypothetical protein
VTTTSVCFVDRGGGEVVHEPVAVRARRAEQPGRVRLDQHAVEAQVEAEAEEELRHR